MNETFIIPHPQKPGCWLVCLGGGTYEVSEAGLCTCDGFHFRGRCKHADAVAAKLRNERECPACGGTGRLHLRETYADPTPLPCLACDGSGRRPNAPARDEAALKRIFA